MQLPKPKISLVICTYNRCKYLPAAFESIVLQQVSKDNYELIVVDNASSDDTSTIVRNFIQSNPQITCRYVFEENKGLSFARNRGIKEAKTEIIAYVDDDVMLSPGYLKSIIDFFEKYPQAVGAGGRVIPKYEDAEPDWMSKYLKGFVGEVNYGDQIKRFDASMKYPAGANMIYIKSILGKAGGFNNELKFRSDDKYIFYAVKNISDEIYYLPDAWLFHFIDAARLSKENFKKLFLKTGNEEKKRLRSQKESILKKGIEYLFKTTAGAGLYLLFTLKGKPSKGKHIWLSQWYTLKGFLQKDVFVR